MSQVSDTRVYHLGKIALSNFKKWKDSVHQVELSSDEVESHEDVRIRSVRVAQALNTRGVGVGDVIVICGDTRNSICLPILASFYIGSAVFPYSNTLSKNEVKRLLSIQSPKIIFCDPCMRKNFTNALEELNLNVEIVIFGDVQKCSESKQIITLFSEFVAPTGTEDDFEVSEFDPETVATITCSSGTTGLPKGICHTHKSLAYPLYMYATLPNLNNKRRKLGLYLTFSSYYWISSIQSLIMTCFTGTPRLICAVPFSVELLDKALKKYKPSMIFLSPVALHNTIKSELFDQLDFSNVDSLFLGGSASSANALKKIKEKIGNAELINGYGFSEVGHVSSSRGVDDSLGQINPWIKWKIVNVETREKVEIGEVGELCVKTEHLFKEYLNDPESTKNSFDDEGYFKTGDLFKHDEQNNIYFVDRLKEVMKFRNFQITPAEVELEISQSPDVIHVCVVGKKHMEDGEHPMAFVEKKQGSNITEQDIHNIVNGNLADHKKLRGGVVFLDKMPETVSGKVNRSRIRELVQQY